MASHLDTLNPPQLKAVTVDCCNCLVLAGAGSGKTRVLVHRIAWLMETQGLSPYSILAVTFTNKAASEMRGRIEAIRGVPLSGMWSGTFHGLSHRLLRAHYQEADLPQDFQIMDTDDQLRIIKRLHKEHDLDTAKWPPKQTVWYINKQKEAGRRAKDINPDGEYYAEVMLSLYQDYEKICQRSGLVDFSELLLRSLELLENDQVLRKHYQDRFAHILVDEFQDTNAIQYRWIKQLCGEHTCIMAVGDDDQSIYSWRGADIDNLHRFQKEFSPVTLVRLEQNYRSTATILDAANSVIANNDSRMGKNLWTDGGRGEMITLYAAFNARDEAYYIANRIEEWVNGGNRYDEIALLYRSNAQSRLLEERMIDKQIPYRIYGGLKFFERAEIKDALAYLRLISNRHDDAAIERIINLPTRGIGDASMTQVRQCANMRSISLWDAILITISEKLLSSRAINALAAFTQLINQIDSHASTLALGEQTMDVIKTSGIYAHHKKDKSEKGQSRVENLDELVNATMQFEGTLIEFLSHVALEAGEGQAEENSNCVNLMTLHSAKGLEFPLVFMTGMEEGLFPHKMSIEEPRGLEEERRLCYVGMTRAKQKLYLTHAELRNMYGSDQYHRPSRFIAEIPNELITAVRPTAKVTSTYATNSQYQRRQPTHAIANTNLQVGQRVSHKKFGCGMIINYEGQGDSARIQVKFDQTGTKWLVASFANLQPA